MNTLLKVCTLVFMLSGCETEADKITTDQCLRQELFQACLKALPLGPNTVATSNDWDEVVAECGSQSYYQAQRKRVVVKPECGLK